MVCNRKKIDSGSLPPLSVRTPVSVLVVVASGGIPKGYLLPEENAQEVAWEILRKRRFRNLPQAVNDLGELALVELLTKRTCLEEDVLLRLLICSGHLSTFAWAEVEKRSDKLTLKFWQELKKQIMLVDSRFRAKAIKIYSEKLPRKKMK